ncbi:MAG: PAS domain-containing protein [Candidatus Aminicenantes bacterium]|nr:PAS domain-containing protein [Candidatus Aminicenantes bacterium]
MENPKPKGPRVIGAIIILLIILFFTIEFVVREAQEFSPTSVTNLLLSSLQLIVLLMFLILLFVLGRNLVKLYLERKRKVAGAHFKTKLLLFFIALSFIPTFLLFFFASDLISRNIEQWFKTPIDRILDDTKSLTEGFYQNAQDAALHYAQQLSDSIQEQKLFDPRNRGPLMDFVKEKLKEYKVDEISIYLNNEEQFVYMNPDLPLRYWNEMSDNLVKRAHLGEKISTIENMGSGQMIRRGVSFNIPEAGDLLVAIGIFLPQNYAQKINNITANVQRYQQIKVQKDPVKTFYLLTLIFFTLLIVFAASWIGLRLAKSISVPIEKLANATREVSKGNLDVRVEDPASDEIGIFIESFNQMISDLKSSQLHIAQKTSELEARKQYIETIQSNITTGIITLDADNNITTINPSARNMLGLHEKDLVGKNYQDVLNQPRYTEIVQQIQKGMRNKYQVTDKEIKIRLDNQTVTLALTLSPLRESENRFSGLILVLDDLSQLIQAQKIAAWKEVAQRVAHEIKNPLTPIQLSAERIIKKMEQSDGDYDKAVKEGAQTIVREAGTIKSLVDEFSRFARMPKIQLQMADIHSIVQQAIAPFRGIFTEVKFTLDFAENIPTPIRVDPEQMRRVLINLIDNAIDAMNKQGEVTLATSFVKIQNQVRIEIADSGLGISDEDKEKLFLPHFSTKKKGTGLGLAVVNQIVNEHKGTIQVEDNQPLGAKFTIQIPI